MAPATLLFTLAGCSTTIEEPACPSIEIPDSTGTCSNLCDCDDEEMDGRVYRVTSLEIDEPEQFASLLNDLWSTDILNNTLNILFVVDTFARNSISSFDSIRFQAGPAWRSPRMPLGVPPEEGQPSESAVESYCLLDGLTAEASVKPYHGNQCVFKTIEDTSLFFHTGPTTDPLVCAPKGEPRNTIPIKNLKIRFGFDQDCRTVVAGSIEGCITLTDADKICMCLVSGSCTVQPKGEGYDPDDLTAYCKDECGDKWLSFGQTVKAFGLAPTCVTSEGDQGYRLQGFISAADVTEKYNPVSSSDCTEQ